MTIRLNPRWLLLPVLLVSLQFCRAQTEIPPSASFSLGSDSPTDCKLWDLTGNYNINLEVVNRDGLSVPVQITFFLLQDATGKLTGPSNFVSGLVLNNDDNSAFAIFPTVSGKVTGSGGFGRAHFSVHFRGNGSLGSVQNVPVTGSFTIDAEMDPSSGLLVARKDVNFKASFGGLNNISGQSFDFATELPPGVDGTWTLSMNLAGISKINGLGSIGMPSEAFGLDLSGRYKQSLDLIELNAKGAGDVPNAFSGRGSNAKVFLTTALDTIKLDGKLLGQKVSLNVTIPTE